MAHCDSESRNCHASASSCASSSAIASCRSSAARSWQTAIAGTEDLWAATARARAFDNGKCFLVCSVVGGQGPDEHFGGSAAYDPHGACVAQAAYGGEDLLVVDVLMDLSRRTRTEMNIVAARRREVYGVLVAPAQQ